MSRRDDITAHTGGKFRYEVAVLTQGEFGLEEWIITVNGNDEEHALRRALGSIDGHDYRYITQLGENNAN